MIHTSSPIDSDSTFRSLVGRFMEIKLWLLINAWNIDGILLVERWTASGWQNYVPLRIESNHCLQMFSIANRYGSINQLRLDVINSHCLWLMSFVSVQCLQENKSTQIKRPWHQIEFLSSTFLLSRLNLYYVGEWKIVQSCERARAKLKPKLRKIASITTAACPTCLSTKFCHFSFSLPPKTFYIIYWRNSKPKTNTWRMNFLNRQHWDW